MRSLFTRAAPKRSNPTGHGKPGQVSGQLRGEPHRPIRLVKAESGEEVEIGEIELFYIDGTRALNNDLDIFDICDSVGQDQYEYVEAVYSDDALDSEIVDDWISNDVLALHKIAILPKYRGCQYGLQVTRKIIETVGSHCGAETGTTPVLLTICRQPGADGMDANVHFPRRSRDCDEAACRLLESAGPTADEEPVNILCLINLTNLRWISWHYPHYEDLMPKNETEKSRL